MPARTYFAAVATLRKQARKEIAGVERGGAEFAPASGRLFI